MSSYLDASGQEPGADLSQLQHLAEQQAAAEKELADAEALVTKAKEKLNNISERLLPEAMERCGLSEFTSATGLKIRIKEDIRASIPKAREALAHQWLRDNGFGSLIKRVVSISFGRGEDEKADDLHKLLEERALEADDKTSVHVMTLKAFVTEQLEQGKDIPLELFGVFRQRKAVIDAK